MDFPPSILFASDSDDPIFPTDDYAYAEALQFQEDYAYAEALQLQETLISPFNRLTTTMDMFEIKGCKHSFCSTCVSMHIEYKLKENIVSISCPDRDCKSTTEPGSVKSIVPEKVLERWEEEIAKLAIPESEKIYCPYENCSKLSINALDDDGNVITPTECPHCGKWFCAVCKVPWHEGFDCKEYENSEQKKKEEEELRSWAKEKKAMECPKCKELVERNEGCIHMTCRCKSEFCYSCGEVWDESHWGTCQEEK